MKTKERYSLEQAADRLGISIRTLTRRIKAGEIEVERDGKRVTIPPLELARYWASRQSRAGRST